jgi:hypothetical protein
MPEAAWLQVEKDYMKKSWLWIGLVFVVLFLVMTPENAWAAPGGKIVTGIFKTTWGKILLGVLTIVLSPVIAYVMIKERIAEKKTLAHLKRLAAVDRNFDWMTLKDRVTDCYHRVHSAWRAEDMAQASDWMTSWYWQNQQLAHLNQWERDGLVNHCRVKTISRIRPLFLKYEKSDDGKSDGSRVVICITAKMEDYLAERESGKIVEGKKGYEDADHVWTFVLQQGKWVVSNIEEGSMSLTYARLMPEVPEVPAGETAAARGA